MAPGTAPTVGDQDTVLTTLKMPRELRDWLRDHAKDQQCTMAGEVRHLIERRRAEVERQGAKAA